MVIKMSQNIDDIDIQDFDYVCDECGKVCDIVEESFDYAGTHCTNGKAGTHYTGYWVSKCCLTTFHQEYDNG